MINFFKNRSNSKNDQILKNSDFENSYNNFEMYTMTSKERMLALYDSVTYVSKNKISGDFVECGVWKGGSSMLMLDLIGRLNLQNELYMYDTFEGMTKPSKFDEDYEGNSAEKYLKKEKKYPNVKALCLLENVKENFNHVGLSINNCHFIKGDVLNTLPKNSPEKISILRLDTDWYESTYHELTYLYPRLVKGGVLIIDDYGHWKGAKKATDEYFSQLGFFPYLHKIDYTGRLIIKP